MFYIGTGGSTRSATKPVKGEKDKDKKGDADKKREWRKKIYTD